MVDVASSNSLILLRIRIRTGSLYTYNLTIRIFRTVFHFKKWRASWAGDLAGLAGEGAPGVSIFNSKRDFSQKQF